MENTIDKPPVQDPTERKDKDLKLEEKKFFLAHNAVQIYYAKLEYRNTHPDADDAPEEALAGIMATHSDDFRAWYGSEGKVVLEKYATEHDEKAIEAMEDMGDLAQSFLVFMNRRKTELSSE